MDASYTGKTLQQPNLKDFNLELLHHSIITAATATMISKTRTPATMPMIHRLDGPAGDTDDVTQFWSSHCIAPCIGRVSVPSRTLFVCSAHWLTSLAMVPLSMLPTPATSARKRTAVGSLGLQAHLPLVMWLWVRLQLHLCLSGSYATEWQALSMQASSSEF